MTTALGPWTATITVRVRDSALGQWLERALQPEASREVPRSTADVALSADGRVTITISALDSGAMRAALNTYLGWVHLSLATARAASSPPRASSRV